VTNPSQTGQGLEPAALRRGIAPELSVSHMRRVGKVCAWVGGVFIFWGIASLPTRPLTGTPASSGSMPSIPPSLELVFAVSTILSGICLLFGGLRFRKRQEHGRRLLLAAVWIGVGYVVVFSIGMAVTMYTASGPPLMRLGMAGVAIVAATFWGLLMRSPIRYFGSTEVRSAVEGTHEAA
jgi:hypothetical protein